MSSSPTARDTDSVVCLDLMDTVLVDPFREALESATGLPLATLFSLARRDAWPRFESGAIDETTYFRQFYREGDARVPPHEPEELRERLTRALDAGYAFQPGMEELLGELRGRVPLYLLSNYPIWFERVRARFDLDRFFDGFYVSTYMGVRKPDREFFEHFLAGTGHRAERCVFVDDRPVNLAAAEEVGMRSFQFESTGRLRAQLSGLGVVD